MGQFIFFVVLIGAAVVAARWFRNRRGDEKNRRMRKQDQPLKITQEDVWSVISAKASALPQPGAVRVSLILTILFGVGGAVVGIGAGVGPGFGVFVLVFGLIFWAMSKARVDKKNMVAQPQDGPFAVRSDAVRTPAGAIIPAASVYRILIENRVDGRVVSSGSSVFVAAPLSGGAMGATALGFAAAGAGIVGMAGALGNASGVKWQKSLHAIGHAVVAEHAGTRTVLASGMTSELAYAVYHELTKRLDGFR